MIVNIEFLGSEPIENLVTCINYKIDKVVYFGYADAIERLSKRTDAFLKKYCRVERTVFQPLSGKDFDSTLKAMDEMIRHEMSEGNKVFIDITGGEDLILVAAGILSRELDVPMHMYDIPDNRLMEYSRDTDRTLSHNASVIEFTMDIDKYIEMMGGVINYSLHKNDKNLCDEMHIEELNAVWNIEKKYRDIWNLFTSFIAYITDGKLEYNSSIKSAETVLYHRNKTIGLNSVNRIFDDLEEKELVHKVKHDNGLFGFAIKNDFVRECLIEGGAVLEEHVYIQESLTADDCRIGVHIDWDGMIHYAGQDDKIDVLNEIDVLSLRGYVPTFISCKSGKMHDNTSLYALYELETVARRFGGKYTKKVIASVQPVDEVCRERAKEMGIEIRPES